MAESQSQIEQDEEILLNIKRELQVREEQTLSMEKMIKSLQDEIAKHESKNNLLQDQIKLLKSSLDKKVYFKILNIKKDNALKQELKSKEISFSKLQSLETENEKLKQILGISNDNQKDSLFGNIWKKINPLSGQKQLQTYSGIQTSNIELKK